MAADTPKTFVFAYGSNLDPERMARRVPSARLVGRARLPGHELRFHKRGWNDGTGKADAHRADRSEAAVHGVVWEMAKGGLAALDVFETGYLRRSLDFTITDPPDAGAIAAWIYLARPEVIDEQLLPARWYLQHVLRGARAHGLPGALIEWLDRLPTEG